MKDMNKNVLYRLISLDSEIVTQQLQNLATKQFEIIKQSKSNDEIIQELGNLEVYCHRAPNESLAIINYVLQMTPLEPRVREIPRYGKLKGADYFEVIDKIIKILDGIQYSLPEDVFKISLNLSISNSDRIKNKALEFLRKIASYDINEMEHIRYGPQQMAIKSISELSDDEKKKYFDGIIVVLDELLNPEVEGSRMTSENTLQIQMGSLGNDADVRDIRQSVIKILEGLYGLINGVPQKAKIISALSNVSRVSLRGNTDEFEELLVKNIDEVLEFYTSIISEADFTVIREIEHKLPWIKRRFGDKVKNISKLKDAIDLVEEYKDFAILTGEGSIDEQYDRLSYEEAQKRVKEEMTNLIDRLAKEDIANCKKLVDSIIVASGYNVESNQFFQFRIFLNEIGKRYPEMGLGLLNSKLCDNEYFLAELLSGLLVGSQEKIMLQMSEWVKNNKHFIACILAFDRSDNFDTEFLEEVLNSVNKDEKILNKLAFVIENSFDKDSKNAEAVKDLYVKTIKELTNFKSTGWSKEIYFDDKCILNYFEMSDWDVVVDNLLFTPSIEYHTEEVCKAMILKEPKLFIKFLGSRIKYSESGDLDDNNKYRILPFDFENLREEIKTRKNIFVPEFLKWLGNKGLVAHEISHILNDIFPLEELDKFLLSKGKIIVDKDTINSLLFGYQGHISITSAFIQSYIIESNEEAQKQMMSLMSMPGGVVTGEYGFSESMKSKLKELDNFQFEDEKIKDFIEKYKQYLKKYIEIEEKKTREEIIIRKEKFKKHLP
jgi:hypothetical protein